MSHKKPNHNASDESLNDSSFNPFRRLASSTDEEVDLSDWGSTALEDDPSEVDDPEYDAQFDNVSRRRRYATTERFDASTQGDQTTREDTVAYERAILVGVYTPGRGLGDDPLAELAGLAEAARVYPVGELIQRRVNRDIAFCLGRGKLLELEALVASRDAQVAIFDLDLSPGQTRNLEKFLQIKVIDRTELILDVFASRAQTREARLAVELAQLEYSMPRLKRMWTHLERQTVGGVGLRGPGEKQLEVDRRIAQKRINDLKRDLAEIHSRKKREIEGREHTRRVCLVGYTNAGKSSLLNAMTGADVFAQDMLFATLDTRTRRWTLPGWGPVLLSDTVGFVRELPHHLVASFRATLEEATTANLLIHVADASAHDVVDQIEAARKTLERLKIGEKDEILVLNKVDALESESTLRALEERYPTAIPISVHEGTGLDKLTAAVSAALSREFLDVFVELPLADGRTAASLARDGEVTSREYDVQGRVTIHVRLPKRAIERLRAVPEITVRIGSRDAEPYFSAGGIQ
ncbi:MAG: GTPase HflX [Thermoguttaceae bacterium]|nr:GTPase HflX [Thermoguttaceae bacterium]